ncbi:divergent polysaccharide deacetylase family protein [Emcibacteraceae bacterium]|nr:divergent polysaccharide deacetylase family protein [Emcibacteraceae bacterium]
MADEPELKTSTKQKVMNPLVLAWGFVLIGLSLTVAWVMFSEEPVQNDANKDQPVTINEDLPQTTITIPDVNVPNSAPKSINDMAIPAEEPSVNEMTKDILATQMPLKAAPNQNLLIEGQNGLKPTLGPDGLIAWKEYARPYEGPEDKPRIAILVTDIGLNSKSSTMAIENLPGQVNLAFSPYGRNLQDWMNKAREKGHEGFLMLPTEPLNYPDSDLGPHTLITDLNERENLSRLDWIISRVGGYVGVVNHMGSKFTASEEALTPIINDLKDRGLMFVDARSTRFSMAARLARRASMPRAINDRYIDNVMTAEEIQKQLGELEKTANTFGAALGIARALPLTINEIATWSMSLEEKGIDLVPVTAIANRQPIK